MYQAPRSNIWGCAKYQFMHCALIFWTDAFIGHLVQSPAMHHASNRTDQPESGHGQLALLPSLQKAIWAAPKVPSGSDTHNGSNTQGSRVRDCWWRPAGCCRRHGGEQCNKEIADIMGKVYKVRSFGLKSVNMRELNPSGKSVSWFHLCDHPSTSLQIPTSSRVSSFVPLPSSQAWKWPFSGVLLAPIVSKSKSIVARLKNLVVFLMTSVHPLTQYYSYITVANLQIDRWSGYKTPDAVPDSQTG